LLRPARVSAGRMHFCDSAEAISARAVVGRASGAWSLSRKASGRGVRAKTHRRYRGGPMVRIQLPPAESPRLAGFRPPTSRSRAFPAGVRGGGGGAVDRDGRGAVTWRRLVGISLSGHIPVPLCSRCGSQQCQHWPASEVRLPRGVTISVSFSAQQLRQSRARSAARASQAADVNAPAACLRSDRAAGVRRGWLR
jgi:hypothetical protein